MLLDELVARLTQLPEKSRTEAIDLAVKSTATMAWVPNPGPQTQAFVCEADELFYGGEAGGGKTDLGIGLALTEHKRSLLLRRALRCPSACRSPWRGYRRRCPRRCGSSLPRR